MESDLLNKDFCIIDLETTGLNTKKDEIISIAIVPLRNLSINMDDVFFTYIKPEKFNHNSIKYHGITEKDVENAPDFKDVAEIIEAKLKNSILVGYSVSVDVEFLKRAFKKKLKKKITLDRYIDVADVEAWLMRKRGSAVTFRLDFESLLKIYRLDESHRHSAIGDAYLTALVFLHQLSQLINHGVSLIDLLRIGRRIFI